jgi:integrase
LPSAHTDAPPDRLVDGHRPRAALASILLIVGINKSQIHILRHTFCSHLAMKNVPPRVIQELAGHADLTTTMRYMHLAKGSKEAAIAVLDQPKSTEKRGDLVETQPAR